MSEFWDVGEFHAKFDLPHSGDVYGQMQKPMPRDLLEFRQKFLQEELDEFAEGMEEGDHAKMFDALIDLVYVALGTAHMAGYPWQAGWDLVQAANMAKVRGAKDGSDSKRGSAWDVVKPEGWEAPNIEGLLRDRGWETPDPVTVAEFAPPIAQELTHCANCGREFTAEDVECAPATDYVGSFCEMGITYVGGTA